eukprot:TRINITY_DN11182_c0_g1_i1.p1 TRINITY_DN11182_c0_g1~~TRINITY_DN11182_c0_g1_i1.p1  ORF type:complete len:236 (+),score=8.59 TRINITY_DN11182_c0_g1_i1:780-1487(+)
MPRLPTAFLVFLLFVIVNGTELPKLPHNFTVSTWFGSWTHGFYVYPSTITSLPPLYILRTYCPNWGGAFYGYLNDGFHFLETQYYLSSVSYNLTYIDGTVRYLDVSGFLQNKGKSSYVKMVLKDSNLVPLLYLPLQWSLGYSWTIYDMDGHMVASAERDVIWATWHISALPNVTNQVLLDISAIAHEYEFGNRNNDGCTGLLFYGLPVIGAFLIILGVWYVLHRCRKQGSYQILE